MGTLRNENCKMGANPQLMAGLGAAFSLFLASIGSGYGSVHAGTFALSTYDSSGWFFAFAPIVIAGVLSIYGIVISIITAGKMEDMTETEGYKSFTAGLSVGLTCLASGLAIGKFLEKHLADATKPRSFRAREQQEQPLISTPRDIVLAPRSGWGVLLVLVFLEAIGLYGLIVALILLG